ncbi:hypothetical protein ACS0TY_024538 [Phlomoides rotata]
MVHDSLNPGMVLVSQQLTCTNFVMWQKSMIIALGAKSKVGFIDDSILPPAKTSPEYVVWKKVDCMVVSWILSSISKDLARTFAHTKYVKCIWDDICERYDAHNGSKLFQLEKSVRTLK